MIGVTPLELFGTTFEGERAYVRGAVAATQLILNYLRAERMLRRVFGFLAQVKGRREARRPELQIQSLYGVVNASKPVPP